MRDHLEAAAAVAGMVPPVEEQPARLWPLLTRSAMADLPPVEWQVEGIAARGLVVVYGQSGVKKSFLALDWSFCTATGHRWFGKRVKAGPVIYVAAEGYAGINQRTAAWEADRETKVPDNWWLIPRAVYLLRADFVAQLRADVKASGARMLVLDTWARSLAGGDENRAEDVSAGVEILGEIVRDGCMVVVVHHSGYDRSHMRGNTALFGAADSVVRVTEDDDSGEIVVRSDKQKDAPDFPTWRLQTKPVLESLVLTLSSRPRDVVAESTWAGL